MSLSLTPSAYARKWYDVYKYNDDRERRLKLLRELTQGFVGTTDCPPVHFLPDLLELYPDVKVVLVTRDPAMWWKSINFVMKPMQMRFFKTLLIICPTWRWFFAMTEYMMIK